MFIEHDAESRVVEYLKKKYKPKAIILHGSRALGLNRENSDWDIYVLVTATIESGSESFEHHILDVTQVVLPLEKYDLLNYFGTTLRGARILLDTDDIARLLLAKADSIYVKGKKLSERTLSNRKYRGFMLLERIRGAVSYPELQFYHIGVFYAVVIRYWFELRGEWPLPPYQALPAIRDRDSTFYESLQSLALGTSSLVKLQAAETLYYLLFPNLTV